MKPVRTRLLKILQRAHRLNQQSRKTGIPLQEVIDQDRELRMYSRRKFLKDSAMAGAALAIPGLLQACATPRTPGQDTLRPSVAIVGAGIAGLHAAHILKKAGIPARIYEASKRAGGRMFSAKNLVAPGTTTELGGEFIDSSHTDILNLCAEFELELLDTYAESELELVRDAFYFDGVSYTEEDIIRAFTPYSASMQADIEALPDEINYATLEPVMADRLSIAEYLEKLGINGWLYTLFEAAYVGEYGLELEYQSALNLLYIFDPDVSEGFHVFGESDERFKIIGGNDSLPKRMSSSMEDQIAYEHKLEALKSRGDRYLLSFANGTEATADFVILAVPFTILREVAIDAGFSSLKKRCINELGYGTNSKLFAGFNNHVWRQQGYQGFVFSDGFDNGWDSSQLQTGRDAPASYTFYTGGKVGAELNKKDHPRFVDHLERVFPGSRAVFNGRVSAFNWPLFPFVKASYTCYRPGQYTGIGGLEAQPQGNVFFAGEHCSFEFQGFMNGAAETGRQAAEALLERL